MKIEDLSLWEAYVAVAKTGNFAKAAKYLREPVPQISKRVAKLESLLEVRLFTRSTRVVKLTDEGQSMLDRAVTLLEDSAELAASFEQKHLITGTLRITSAPYVAHRLLIPVFKEYRALYPKVNLEIDLSETVHDLYESQFDIAIRSDEPGDSSLVYRRLFTNHIAVCASPDYLRHAKHAIKTPKDLKHHPILMLEVLKECGFKNKGYTVGDLNLNYEIKTDSGLFLLDLAKQGFGVLIRALWDVRAEVEKGNLVQLLQNHPLEPFGNLYAVIPSRKYLAPRVRVFIDLITERAKAWEAELF